MELTIEEAFRRGDQAYKEGNINEADKFFTKQVAIKLKKKAVMNLNSMCKD